MPRPLIALAMLCATLPLAGCSTLLPWGQPPTQLASKTLADMPVVRNTPKAPCVTQREIAAQNTYRAAAAGTLPSGTVYTAPCDLAPKPTPVS